MVTGVAAGAILLGIYALLEWPGAYTPDSIVMAWQATGQAPTTNFHPLFLVGLYRLAILAAGAAGPWILQTALICSAFGILWTSSGTSPLRRCALVIAFASPMALAITSTVGKDALCAGLFALLLALALTGPTGRSAGIAAIACAVMIPLVRMNAFPLSAIAATAWPFNTHLRLWARAAALMLAGLLLAAGGQWASGAFADYRVSNSSVLAAWDLTAIASATSDVSSIPAEVRRVPRACTLEELRAQYSAETSDPLVFPDDACVRITKPESYEEMQALQAEGADGRGITTRAWLSAIASHPLEYLGHRAAVAVNLLGMDGTNQTLNADSQHPGVATLGEAPWPPPLAAVRDRAVAWTSSNLNAMWAPWIALVFCILGLAAIRSIPALRTMAVLIGVALGGFLAVTLVLAPATDIRYMYPLWVVAGLSLAYGFPPWLARRRAGNPPGLGRGIPAQDCSDQKPQ